MDVTRELRKVARLLCANIGIMAINDDVEFIYDPFSAYLQIGMGGEWWSGTVKPGKNVFVHPKEHVDEAYVPVIVEASRQNERGAVFIVSGGFYGKTTKFELSLT